MWTIDDRRPRLSGILVAIVALPLVLLQVRCAGTHPAAAPPPPEDPAKVERERQARAACADGLVGAAAAAYREGDLDKARDFFARAIPDLEPRVHAVTDALAFVPLARHRLLVPAIEKDFGKLPAGAPGGWVDARAGYAVVDRQLADCIAAAFLPEPKGRQVFIASGIFLLTAPAAREWSVRVTGDDAPRDWIHPWSGSFADLVREMKTSNFTQTSATPFVLSDDRTEGVLYIGEHEWQVGASRDARLPGIFFDVWPRIEGDRVRLLLDVRTAGWKDGTREVLVETARWELDERVPAREGGVFAGRAPTDDEVANRAPIWWLYFQARVVEPDGPASLQELMASS